MIFINIFRFLMPKKPAVVFAVTGLLAALGAVHAQTAPSLQAVATGLDRPWAVAFLPDGRFVVTEKAGRMRVVAADGRVGPPLAGVPEVVARGQGGLLDVVADAQFEKNRTLYFCYAEPGQGGSSTALSSAQLSADGTALQGVKRLFSQQPKVASNLHFGCRIVQTADGKLFLTLGERYQRMQDAQRLDNHHGKVIRLQADGSVPSDNPFLGRAGALPEIWSYGHRNLQGATLGPDSLLWTHEHGPQGGDEINIARAGRNYGWPVITYGENYGGGKIGDGITAKDGLEQPLHYWVPSIAPSGMAFLSSPRYGKSWQGNLFVGSLKFNYLARLELTGEKVTREHKIEVGQRVRDVRQGLDGLLYVLTDSEQGRLLRLVP